jgi:hypothetical protein
LSEQSKNKQTNLRSEIWFRNPRPNNHLARALSRSLLQRILAGERGFLPSPRFGKFFGLSYLQVQVRGYYPARENEKDRGHH